MLFNILVFLICIAGIVEALIMALVDWEDLPISVRKSPRKLYNVLKEEMNLPKDWNELSVIERRSRKRRYNLIRQTVATLPNWNDLSILNRRSHKDLYNIIKSSSESLPTGTMLDVPVGTVIFEEDCSEDKLDSYDDVVYIYNRNDLIQEPAYENDCLVLNSINTTSIGFLPIKPLESVANDFEIELERPTANNEVNTSNDKTVGFFIFNGDTEFKAIYITQLSLGWKWNVRCLYYDENDSHHNNITESTTKLDTIESVKLILQGNRLSVDGIEDAYVELDRNQNTQYGLFVNNRGASYSSVKITTI